MHDYFSEHNVPVTISIDQKYHSQAALQYRALSISFSLLICRIQSKLGENEIFTEYLDLEYPCSNDEVKYFSPLCFNSSHSHPIHKSDRSKSPVRMRTSQPVEECTSTTERKSPNSFFPREHKEKAASGFTWLSNTATSLWSAAREKATSHSPELVSERVTRNRPNSPRIVGSHARYAVGDDDACCRCCDW